MASPFRGMDKVLVKAFKRYHRRNPMVYLKFKEIAQQMRGKGHKEYSAMALINVIRWQFDLCLQKDVFKIPNDYVALYARKLAHDCPHRFGGFFRLNATKKKRIGYSL